MKKVVIGYLYNGRGLGRDEQLFKRAAKKKNVDFILINTSEWSDYQDFKEKIKQCDILYNSSGDDFVIEIEKTVEELGKKIIENSKSFYYCEDKWMFFLKCKEHGIPTPETILLAQDITEAKKDLKKFNHWPVILKRIGGTMGQYVDRAKNLSESEKIIKKFWKKGSERIPIIAQECILSPSYRVTVIGDEIVQTAVKKNKGWKATGVYATKITRFKVDKELKKLVKKIIKFSNIKICGIDFLKQGDKWIALEVNSAPGFDFFDCERAKLSEKLVDFLKSSVKKN